MGMVKVNGKYPLKNGACGYLKWVRGIDVIVDTHPQTYIVIESD